MENEWYQTETEQPRSSSESGLLPPAEERPAGKKRRRRSWIGWTAAAAAVVALIALSSILFAARDADQGGFSLPGGSSEREDSPSDFSDFRDFFEHYYTSTEQSAGCDIPRVESLPGGELRLVPEGEELTLQEIYRRCSPSIVGIRAYWDKDTSDSYYWGTGIVMTEDGIIVTNAHIVAPNDRVPCRATVVLPDDSEEDALLIGYDNRSDLALLKIEARGLQPAEFGDLASLEVGDSVVAIGNPLQEEFRNSMTEGIISGIDRGVNLRGGTMTLIQTTAPINEGNSGGPLINRSGQVIGITNMKMSANYLGSTSIEGVGFAIPSTTVQKVTDSLRRYGEMVGRPALGITVGPIPDTARNQYELPEGLYISAVAAGSDCEAKGILPGDVLVAVDGENVMENQQVLDRIQEMEVGDTLTLTIWRQEKDESRSFDVTVALMDMKDIGY